ncbi:crotonobetainyl-CoA:carnitine CoA-transferase CaiB-like acyl-CoA transferase [Melghiribacillus thermohalophilus]|uniref:Crotonobetainyl-CoA:carnitine CoA-transferase CaiB-like acyl-CoA transferase n=1 Tax=Melghiribacillus thermohalophilus TaxID=1324956 RepID=A0A4R3N039_9BACI|nr:CaiB/BaiF CoA-transferase family protein [Melghiribacillus thermohalophilus]TCT22370.1 crotonobetainyl-CoA:carnitine CoA-transferase CaiB-like acyl-CoA transferase [Melghiribacillus thermohalophilus]
MLQGIRILDFTQYLPGPFASLRLAEYGAEVIKIEPLNGDPAKYMTIHGHSPLYTANNRNKKSMTLNLKTDEGQRIARQLIEQSDVVMESFRPGVMKRLGLDYEQVKTCNENIIYLSLTGFGQKNSMAHLGSHDLNYVALSGTLDQLRDQHGKPVHPSIPFADLIGGIAASEAILAALVQKGETGKGTYIDLALSDVMVSMMNSHVMISHLSGNKHGVPILDGSFIHYHIYETKDGRYMSLAALEYKFWKNFCEAAGKPDWVRAYPDHMGIEDPLYQEVKRLFLSRTQKEWTDFGLKHDCCLFPVLDVNEITHSSYIQERQLIHFKDSTPFVRTFFSENQIQGNIVPLPEPGEHTEEILTRLLKVERKKIDEWKKKGVIK